MQEKLAQNGGTEGLPWGDGPSLKTDYVLREGPSPRGAPSVPPFCASFS